MYRAPRGTSDVLPQDQSAWRYMETTASTLAEKFGYQRIDTPVIEQASLFKRTTGNTTDIVEKEMYVLHDRGGDELALRPEGTASICRAYLEHGMHSWPQPVRLYYFCSIFRYDRPQAGRYREHHQFGIESIGESDPSIDTEVIELAWRLYEKLGLQDFQLFVNSIGDQNCRPGYLDALLSYYQPRRDSLCSNCQDRMNRNPLRLLDCKQERCLSLTDKAPQSVNYLCDSCAEHWGKLLEYLEILNVPYLTNPRLVRGLDYYTRTVFEIQPREESAQAALCGGGRYDDLIGQIGKRNVPGVGFATGLERILLNLRRQGIGNAEQTSPEVILVHLGNRPQKVVMHLASRLRQEGLSAIVCPTGRTLKGQLRYASAMGAPFVLILGEDELAQGIILLRDMGRGTQESINSTTVYQAILRARQQAGRPMETGLTNA